MIASKRTKIVCTIGPASEKQSTLEKMIRAGMNVARLNFSHGTHAHHCMLMRNIRAAARRVGVPIAILADLQGPKVRVGVLPETGVRLRKGATVTFRAGAEKMEGSVVPIPYAGLARDLKKGDHILLDDGLLEVVVQAIRSGEIITRVIMGGVLTSHKGFNVPTATLHLPAVTKKDKEDLYFALSQNVDFVALSFVRTADEVHKVRKILDQKKTTSGVKIIVKIEKHEAIKNFSKILEAADGIMVARGDLGIEIPAEDVPVLQKEIIEVCLGAAKPVIVATHMLDSMIRNPRPTRAEVSDVANAVIDHADAVMLSGESANGKYPVQAVAIMARIIRETEASRFDDLSPEEVKGATQTVGQAVGEAAGILADAPRLKGIVVTTMSGASARDVIRFRPELPIVTCTPDDRVMRQLALSWGALPLRVQKQRSMSALSKSAIRATLQARVLKRKQEVLLITGSPVGKSGMISKVEIVRL